MKSVLPSWFLVLGGFWCLAPGSSDPRSSGPSGPLSAAAIHPDSAQEPDFVSLFDGKTLTGWVLENITPERAYAEDETLTVHKSFGWVRARKKFADFVLKIDFRFDHDDTEGGVFVRAYPMNDADRAAANNSYEIPIASSAKPDRPLAKVIPHGTNPKEVAFSAQNLAKVVKKTGEWQSYEIECVGDKLTVKLNGELITSVQPVENLVGSIGFQVRNRYIEFKNIRVRELPSAGGGFGRGAYDTDEEGIEPPRIISHVRPVYPQEAMQRNIQGSVEVEVVVLADGSVGDARVVRSAHSLLDEAALQAVKQWRFAPGTRFGQPVPVMVITTHGFTLK